MKGSLRAPLGSYTKWVFVVLAAMLLATFSFAPAAYASSTQAMSAQNSQLSAPAQVAAPARAAVKWIDINLRTQTLTAFQGLVPVYSTRISSGVAKHPTRTGTFHVYTKIPSQRMTGGVGREHYDLPNVPNVMYFYGANAIHGAYWHNNFGRPMSHGCINLPLRAAAWMYSWTPVGTTVVVHY